MRSILAQCNANVLWGAILGAILQAEFRKSGAGAQGSSQPVDATPHQDRDDAQKALANAKQRVVDLLPRREIGPMARRGLSRVRCRWL
jgi:hypothetical protein